MERVIVMTIYNNQVMTRRFNWQDIVIIMFILSFLYTIIQIGSGMNAPFNPNTDKIAVSLSPWNLPYYAIRSISRMLLAYFGSIIFSVFYGYLAAKNKIAGKIMIPILDILQSIPVLCFLAATLPLFVSLFPHSLLGVEISSIFIIFTAQTWNTTFSFYNSMITLPKDLMEASMILRLNWWKRFLCLEIPYSIIGLVWNSMMSFGGAWFFLAASESVLVLKENIMLPGVGSYLSLAIIQGNFKGVVYSILAMIFMITIVDQFFWRPLVLWSQKFKMEFSEAKENTTSWVYDILYGSSIVVFLSAYIFVLF